MIYCDSNTKELKVPKMSNNNILRYFILCNQIDKEDKIFEKTDSGTSSLYYSISVDDTLLGYLGKYGDGAQFDYRLKNSKNDTIMCGILQYGELPVVDTTSYDNEKIIKQYNPDYGKKE